MLSFKRLLLILSMALMTACVGVPKGISPVKNFDADRYLGQWYEIARLDHPFERNLEQVSATYSKQENGLIKVVNKGYNIEKNKWSEAEGKAKFVEGSDIGHLKVSFFGPFYSSYVIFYLSDDYQHAFITGNDRSYLWWLSRSPKVSEEMKQTFMREIQRREFDTAELHFVKHD